MGHDEDTSEMREEPEGAVSGRGPGGGHLLGLQLLA